MRRGDECVAQGIRDAIDEMGAFAVGMDEVRVVSLLECALCLAVGFGRRERCKSGGHLRWGGQRSMVQAVGVQCG